jgi:hypothetical protein
MHSQQYGHILTACGIEINVEYADTGDVSATSAKSNSPIGTADATAAAAASVIDITAAILAGISASGAAGEGFADGRTKVSTLRMVYTSNGCV